MADFMRQYTGTIMPSEKIRVLNTIGNGMLLCVFPFCICNYNSGLPSVDS